MLRETELKIVENAGVRRREAEAGERWCGRHFYETAGERARGAEEGRDGARECEERSEKARG